jgi:four helix bundle protein
MTWPEQLKKRTRDFSLGIVRFCRTLPGTIEMNVFRHQLIKAGTSVGANYRATCRGRSTAEKKAKIGIAIEECDESAFWLELLADLDAGDRRERQRLTKEADELNAILYSCRRGMGKPRTKNATNDH